MSLPSPNLFSSSICHVLPQLPWSPRNQKPDLFFHPLLTRSSLEASVLFPLQSHLDATRIWGPFGSHHHMEIASLWESLWLQHTLLSHSVWPNVFPCTCKMVIYPSKYHHQTTPLLQVAWLVFPPFCKTSLVFSKTSISYSLSSLLAWYSPVPSSFWATPKPFSLSLIRMGSGEDPII